MVLQLVKKFPAFYGTRMFITIFTSARHLSLSWANSTQSPQPPPTSWRSILILSSHYTYIKIFTITPPLYYLPPSYLISSELSRKFSLNSNTVISFISLPYQCDKHSSFFLCNVLSPPSTLPYSALHAAVQHTISILPLKQNAFHNKVSRNTTLHSQRTIHIYN